MGLFEEFRTLTVEADGVPVHVRTAGHGPPLLLLHGFPQTHAMWHAVAPRLAEEFTVVATDLRGYGASGRPPTTADHTPYTKRAMAAEQVRVMAELGHDRFHVAGHDRGARCAYRLALDHPEKVDRLAVLDVVPTADALAAVDAASARQLWRWFLLAQPHPLPERLIAADPEAFYFGAHAGLFAPEALAAYRTAVSRPAVVHAMCEDYRAMFGLDLAHDEADLAAGRRITAPVLALWGKRSHTERRHDVLGVWRRWADDVRGRALDCGHFLPEEAPEATYAELRAFFRDAPPRAS
ncbi:alpha/beta fold hydrolase [Streptomyces fulvoviolaceus]|uniref:alpha/beta fold hydrolase n=1 Tax=Streptomyces fulvoviolaceus TaxID=285535 RepID=UPI0004CB2A63|nr:alpha/beta hydrolase [Streptomyces fulvoviolaceus]